MLVRPRRLFFLLCTWRLVVAGAPALAAGVPVGVLPGPAQLLPSVLADPAGGAMITYKTADGRAGAVHVSAAGVPDGGPGFAPTTLPVTIGTSEPLRIGLFAGTQLAIASDHASGSAPALTRLTSSGATAAGFPVSVGMTLDRPALVPGLGDRTVLIAKNSDAVTYWTLRAAVVSASGVVEHAAQLQSPIQFFNADRIEAASDGAGGVIAAMPYYDVEHTGSKDLCMFRYAADGSRPWGDQPRLMIVLPRDQSDPRLVPDGAGGVFMAWTDPRTVSGSSDIYALRVDANGARSPGWLFYGRPVCSAAGEQTQARIVRSGTVGAWIAWLDQRNDAGDLRYSQLLGNGELGPGFTTAGAVLCEAAGAQRELAIAPDGGGGFFAVWRDDRSSDAELYAQHVLGSGLVAPGWPAQGRALVEAAGIQDQPAIAALPGGRVIIAWRDARAGTARIYALMLDDPANAGSDLAPAGALALAVATPTRGALRVSLTVHDPGEATLELLDVSGRLRDRVRLAGPLREYGVTLRPASALEPGVYLVRLRNATGAACARACILR
jgi:hypothetical protein